MIDEASIRSEVESEPRQVDVHEEWLTPSGRPRKMPVYEGVIENGYLGATKVVRGKSIAEVEQKARAQFEKWNQQEIRKRIADAKNDAAAQAEEMTRDAKAAIEALETILAATLDVDDRLDWDEMMDRRAFPAFQWDPVKPERPKDPKRSLWEALLPPLKKRRARESRQRHQDWKERVTAWQAEQRQAQAEHDAAKARFEESQHRHNEALQTFRERFESGDVDAIVEYSKNVFERSVFPDGYSREYEVSYDTPSETLVVDVSLPEQAMIPDILEYRYTKSRNEMSPKQMKRKDHDALYEESVRQTVLRTLHEMFEAHYTEHVKAVVVNGWVTSLNEATGHDVTACVISVSTDRESFEAINLARVNSEKCITSLKGIVAGPLSQVAPVKPIMQLKREDSRFVDSRDVLADVDVSTNLAEISWEDFEHLVRELFSELFSADGAEVRVTQASSDGGIDAVAFDPDPIRGGKFVIQAKRYTKVVGVSAVRDLYGTMISEGASKGILVTTAHFGRESRRFAEDKPITLIDGSNLVYLLEEHGHSVRIDVEEARRQRRTNL